MENIYHYRINAQDNGNSLVEFIDLPENKEFVTHLIHAFAGINLQIVNYDDLWIEEEILLKAKSDIGNIAIIRDTAGFYSIIAKADAIAALDSILSRTPGFKKI